MATDILRRGAGGPVAGARSGSRARSKIGVLQMILQPIASLKVTVILFALSIILVLVGTLAQTEMDMWLVLQKYFTAVLCWIDLHLFFPKTWFPPHEYPGLSRFLYHTFPIPFPGGATIGAAMVANLLAAHAIRFQIQVRGGRLLAGLAMLLAGCVLTSVIILSGHNNEGLQAAPPFAWTSLWLAVKIGLAVVSVGLVVATLVLWRRQPGRLVVTSLLGVLAASSAILSAWLFYAGEEAYLGNSGMRILWQLIKAEAAAVVLWAGCAAVFRKRAGIVLLHSGVLLMMFGQFLVSQYDVEEQLVLEEGETVGYGRDIRAVELALVRPSSQSGQEDVVVVPLVAKGAPTPFVQGKVQDEKLPFDIEIVSFEPNATVAARRPGDDNPATAGFGLTQSIVPLQPVAGTSGSEVAQAAAYVRFRDKASSRDLGTYLLSQLIDSPERVAGDSGAWDVYLRFKRNYKDYSVELVDVRKDDYIGTSTPRNYSSDVVIKDANHDREVRIWMNNPLRFKGETFYQSGYAKLPGSGVEVTTLQLVRNGGWMIPYVACMIVATGLTVHFCGTLLRFLGRYERQRNPDQVPGRATSDVDLGPVSVQPNRQSWRALRSPDPSAQTPASDPSETFWTMYAIPAAMVGVLALYTLSKALPPRAPAEGPNLVEFGRLPVAFEGRVKPLDTVARASLRILSNRETVVQPSGDKLPAIRWLADVMSHSAASSKHAVFRIDNLDLLHTLNLERRKGFLYALQEIEPRMEEFRRQVALAQKLPAERQGTYEKKVLELEQKFQLFLKISESHRVPDPSQSDAAERASFLIAMAQVGTQLVDGPVPYLVPSGNDSKPWGPLTVAAAQAWVQQLARENDCNSAAELGGKLSAAAMTDAQIEELAFRRLREDIQKFANRDQTTSSVDDLLARLPANLRAELMEKNRQDVREHLGRNIQHAIEEALRGKAITDEPQPAAVAWMALLASYKQGDAAKFQTGLDNYREILNELQPQGLNPGRIGREAYFNHFSPFFYAAWMYLVPFVLSCAAALTWFRVLNRTAFWTLLFVFAVHTVAIVLRIEISGRPPVTNLYSSAIFIGWGGVLLGIVLESMFRMGFGNIVASVCGFATLFVGFLLNTVVFEHKGDTMTVMQAVLDTQFWLATHVVCITLGYSTTFLAGGFGIIYVILGVFSRQLSKLASRELARMIYGTLCFAMLFSFVGTVLGGLWADDSWGRFWGWDPKENGALIIVLWNALVLHARWDGWIRDRGLAVLSIGGNIVTSWSWFGVNELGVGLHAYGFTEGVLFALGLFVLSQAVIIGIGLLPESRWVSRIAPERS